MEIIYLSLHCRVQSVTTIMTPNTLPLGLTAGAHHPFSSAGNVYNHDEIGQEVVSHRADRLAVRR